jgi:hypothetical protein
MKSLMSIILQDDDHLTTQNTAEYTLLCQFKGELLSYFETIETYIGIIILAQKCDNGLLDYVTLEQAHLSKSTTTRKITKAIDISTELGYHELSSYLEYFRQVLWLRNFFAHSNFYLKESVLVLIKRSQDETGMSLVLSDEKCIFITQDTNKISEYWNNKSLSDIVDELDTKIVSFKKLIENYTDKLDIKTIKFY